MVELLEILHQMLTDGLTWATAISIILAVHKWRDSTVKRKRNDELLHKIDLLLKERDLEWNGPHETLRNMDLPNFGRFFSLLRKGLKPLKRRQNMNTAQKINYVTMTVSILGAVKIILQSRGYDIIDDNQINAIANAVGVVATIVGVVMSHRKPKTEGVQTLDNELSYTPGNNR